MKNATLVIRNIGRNLRSLIALIESGAALAPSNSWKLTKQIGAPAVATCSGPTRHTPSTKLVVKDLQGRSGACKRLSRPPRCTRGPLRSSTVAMPDFIVPTSTGPLTVGIPPGASTVFLGANGAGKTRLGVKIENDLGAKSEVHRIGAHRSLVLNTKVQPPSYEIAERRLLYGYDQCSQSPGRPPLAKPTGHCSPFRFRPPHGCPLRR